MCHVSRSNARNTICIASVLVEVQLVNVTIPPPPPGKPWVPGQKFKVMLPWLQGGQSMEAAIPPGGKAGDNLRLSVRGRRQTPMHSSVQKERYCVALPVAFRCCFGAWQRKVVSRTCNVDYQLEIDRTIQSYQKAIQLRTAVIWAAGAAFTLDFAFDSWLRGRAE